MFLPQAGHGGAVQGLMAGNDFTEQAVEDAQMLLAGGKILLIGAHVDGLSVRGLRRE
jgi:hypothetical protein